MSWKKLLGVAGLLAVMSFTPVMAQSLPPMNDGNSIAIEKPAPDLKHAAKTESGKKHGKKHSKKSSKKHGKKSSKKSSKKLGKKSKSGKKSKKVHGAKKSARAHSALGKGWKHHPNLK